MIEKHSFPDSFHRISESVFREKRSHLLAVYRSKAFPNMPRFGKQGSVSPSRLFLFYVKHLNKGHIYLFLGHLPPLGGLSTAGDNSGHPACTVHLNPPPCVVLIPVPCQCHNREFIPKERAKTSWFALSGKGILTLKTFSIVVHVECFCIFQGGFLFDARINRNTCCLKQFIRAAMPGFSKSLAGTVLRTKPKHSLIH